MEEKFAKINVQDPYYQAVKVVFENWTAFELAVTHSFAGPDTQEAAEWFLNSTYIWILENPDLEQYELEEFLANTMDKELNVELEDNSEVQVAAWLLGFAQLYRAGKIAELNHEVALKNLKKNTQSKACVSVGDDPKEDESSGEDDEDDEPMDEAGQEEAKSKNKSALTKEDESNFENMDEGWTLVTKTGKHLTK